MAQMRSRDMRKSDTEDTAYFENSRGLIRVKSIS